MKMRARNKIQFSTVKLVFFTVLCMEIITPILGMNMWTSLENRPSKKQCVSPCKIFHTWCKNNGRCREKAADCTWYCECPENCNGFFCEKILTNGTDSGVPAGGETFEVKVLVEKEKKKKVSTFDKSKLAQALAGIILDRDAPPSKSGESKAESPTIDRIDTGGEISVKENITKTIIVNCTPSNDTNIMTDKSGDKQNVNTSTALPPTLIETTLASNGSKSTPFTTTLASSTASMTSDTSTDATVMSEGSNKKNPIKAHSISAGKTSELLEIIEKALQVEKITTPPSSSSTPTTTLTPFQSSDTTTTTTIKTASSEQVTTTATTKSTASSGEKISSALNTENNKDKSPSMGTSPSESMSSSVINNDNLARSAINMTAGANESHGHVSKLATSLSKMDGKIRTAETEPPLEVLSAPSIVDKVPKQKTDKKEQTTLSTKTDGETTSTGTLSTEGLDVAKNDIAMKETGKGDTNVRETHTEGSGFPPKDIESSSAPYTSTPITSPDTLVSSTSTQKHGTSTQPSTKKPTETMVKSQAKSNAVKDEVRKLSETSTSQMMSPTTLLQKPDADTNKEPETTANSASVPTTKASISTSTQKLTTPTTSAESTSSVMSGSPSSATTTVVSTQTAPASASALDIPDVEKANSNKISKSQHESPNLAPTDIISSPKPEQSASTTQTQSTSTTTATTSTTEISTPTAENIKTPSSTETSANTLKPSSAATTTPETQTSTTATSTTETKQKLNSTTTTTTSTASSTEPERSKLRIAGSGVERDIKPIVAGAADLSVESAGHFKDFHELSALSNKLSESVKDIKLEQIKQELLDKNIPLNELNNIL